MPRRRRIPLWPFVIVLVLAVFAWLDYRRAADGELPTSVQLSDEGRAAGRLSQELLAQGKRKEAEALLRERIALEPEAPLLHYALGVAHVTAESWTDAAEAFRIEVGRSPQHVGTRRGLATALGHLSQHAEAAEHWQALLEIAPGDPEAELELGTHLRELGRG
ncbi:MAG: tetratricopeptide repeat protein, partial [Acidobacteriota bacterium]